MGKSAPALRHTPANLHDAPIRIAVESIADQ